MNYESLAFPIGKYVNPTSISKEDLDHYINEIEDLPGKLSDLALTLSNSQLDLTYRPGGWTLRQVIHHLPDSHINAYIRIKLALTEDKPLIKPYREDLWSELKDVKNTPIETSINLLIHLHARWVQLLRSIDSNELKRTFIHPEHNTELKLDKSIAHYAWHGNHHLAQIENTLNNIKKD